MTEVGNKVGNKVKTMDVKTIVPELCEYTDEQEWFEFKVNWFEPQALGGIRIGNVECCRLSQV